MMIVFYMMLLIGHFSGDCQVVSYSSVVVPIFEASASTQLVPLGANHFDIEKINRICVGDKSDLFVSHTVLRFW